MHNSGKLLVLSDIREDNMPVLSVKEAEIV